MGNRSCSARTIMYNVYCDIPINQPVIGQGVIEDLCWSEGPVSSVILYMIQRVNNHINITEK